LKSLTVGAVGIFGALTVLAAAIGSAGWWVLLVCGRGLVGLGVHDVVQQRHSVLRNSPVLGHLRFLLEDIRPELQLYFIERNFDGRPYDRDTRTPRPSSTSGPRACTTRFPSAPTVTCTRRVMSIWCTRRGRWTRRWTCPRCVSVVLAAPGRMRWRC